MSFSKTNLHHCFFTIISRQKEKKKQQKQYNLFTLAEPLFGNTLGLTFALPSSEILFSLKK